MDRAAEQVLLSASADFVSDDAAFEQHQIVLKCVFDTSSPFFMLYTFTVGYLLPALLITFFYAQVILKLRNDALAIRKQSDGHGHGQNPSISSARLHKVTKRIVAVILFYFFCWTPYWTLNIMSQFGIIVVSWSTLTLSSVFFAAHLLVCFNSAANPVLYALINRELRQQHAQAFQKRRRSLHLVTNNALGFIDKKLPSPTNKMKEHRLASVGCTEDTQFRLLGNGLTSPGQKTLLGHGQLYEKRSSSFSHSSPALVHGQQKTRLSQLWLFGRHFGGSGQLLALHQSPLLAITHRRRGSAQEQQQQEEQKPGNVRQRMEDEQEMEEVCQQQRQQLKIELAQHGEGGGGGDVDDAYL